MVHASIVQFSNCFMLGNTIQCCSATVSFAVEALPVEDAAAAAAAAALPAAAAAAAAAELASVCRPGCTRDTSRPAGCKASSRQSV